MAKAKDSTAKTSAQVVVDFSTGELATNTVADFKRFREMRLDPTIGLAREFAVAPILASTWSVDGNDENAKAYLKEQFLTLRTEFLRTALYGEIDFGWKGYEVVFNTVKFTFPDGTSRVLTGIQEMKPLKNDNTLARYNKDDGRFIGFSYVDQYNGNKVLIDEEHSLFVNFDDEGTGDYATGRMARAKGSQDAWEDANDAASRYDKKMAGTFLVVYYPVGKTPYKNGLETDNSQIAEDIIKAIRSSGSVIIPIDVQNQLAELQKGNKVWEISFLDPQSKQASFVDRMKYLDALKARAFAIPERSILEGEFGTKAEAGIHASAALLNMQLHHENLTELLNSGKGSQKGLVEILLEENFGETGQAWLTAVPLSDDRRELFIKVFEALLADAGGGPEVLDSIDKNAIVEVLGIPVLTDDETSTQGEDVDDSSEADNLADDSQAVPVEATAVAQPPSRPTTVTIEASWGDDPILADLDLCGGAGSGVPGPCPSGGNGGAAGDVSPDVAGYADLATPSNVKVSPRGQIKLTAPKSVGDANAMLGSMNKIADIALGEVSSTSSLPAGDVRSIAASMRLSHVNSQMVRARKMSQRFVSKG